MLRAVPALLALALAVAVADTGCGAAPDHPNTADPSANAAGLTVDGTDNTPGWPTLTPPASTAAGPGAGGGGGAAHPTTPPVPAKPATTTKPPVRPAGPPPLPGQTDAATALLTQINGWRHDAGQPPLTMTPGLVASAHQHDLVMAAGCGMQHQCPQEAAFGDRIKAQGVSFHYAEENIATGGRVANTVAAITSFAQGMNAGMHDEKPPDDGHRTNMLSPQVTRIGIDVVIDATGHVWLTEDFAS
jgi:uncharacterized protein YkwD